LLEFSTTITALRTGTPATIARLKGSVDGTSLAQFQAQLRSLANNQERFVALILSELKYINSSGMGALLKAVEMFTEIGGRLVVVDLSARMRELFERLNLLDVLKAYDTIGDALRAFEEADGAGATAVATDAKPLYPILVRCTGCRQAVEIPDAGYFRCPDCGTCFAAAREGKVRGYKVDPAVSVEVRGPCQAALSAGLRELGAGLAAARGLDADERDALGGLLGECLRALAAGASAPEAEFRVSLAIDQNEVRVAVRAPEPLFTAEGVAETKDAVRTVRAHLDEMEIVSLPDGGQLLRGVRRVRRVG
jgi:anti-sigma B factor antagonist